MTEVLGVIASGIAIAQVAGTAAGAVVKLKKLWDEVKNVPEIISDLMEQIDCLDPILWEAEQQVLQNRLPPQLWDDTVAIRSTRYCRKALQKLTCVADDLASQINSKRRIDRGISRTKVLLKKDRLRDLEQHLESAVRMLQLAQQGYLVSLVKCQPDIIAYKVMSRLEVTQRPNSLAATDLRTDKKYQHQNNLSDSESLDTRVFHDGKGKSSVFVKSSTFGSVGFVSTSQGFTINTQPPRWLTNVLSAWSLNIAKSYSGWKFHLRNYSIRPPNSLVFRGIKEDNVHKLQEMFDSGEASPFDRDPYGATILHYAVTAASVKVLTLLKNLRLKIDCPNDADRIATDWSRWYENTPTSNTNTFSECARLMSSDIFITRDFEDCRDYCRCIPVPDVESFQQLQSIVCPAHHETPLDCRLRKVESFAKGVPKYSLKLEIFQQVLNPDLTEDLNSLCNYKGTGPRLIHIIALYISKLDLRLGRSSSWQQGETERWTDFARNVIRRSDLHNISNTSRNGQKERLTPLMYMILIPTRYVMIGSRSKMERSLLTALRKWLSILKTMGIDLVQYGREEMRILHSNRLQPRKIRVFHSARNGLSLSENQLGDANVWMGCYRLNNLQFGPNVDDWSILWSEPTDKFAGDFWNMIEDPMPYINIPGAWHEIYEPWHELWLDDYDAYREILDESQTEK
ncbi:hypothetical protein F4806DRAFT_500705 [Annulohypoxylon nitens]|nr:hypothetical protein F4806DRAFT_500705 [Annulohypoxylon nitens]